VSSRNDSPAPPVLSVTTLTEVPIENSSDESHLAHALEVIDCARIHVEIANRDIRRDPPDRRRKRAVLELATALTALERAQDALARR
jgi:hypothetical protein